MAMLAVDIRTGQSAGFMLEATFEAPAGITILFGRSGSGKTTLLNSIAGLVRPETGRIALDERVMLDTTADVNLTPAHRAVGFLFQDLALFPHLTAQQNVEYGLAKLPAPERRRRAAAMLDAMRVGSLGARKPAEISGGERQRVALARSLVTEPAILLLDEPLAALDAITKSAILDDLREWNSAHAIPIIYVTHSIEEAFAIGENVIVLETGKIIARGHPLEVLDAPRQEIIAQLAGFENLFDVTIESVLEERGTMVCALSGSKLELEVPITQTRLGAPLRVAIRAGDIMIASTHPNDISARNVFRGTIAAIRIEGHSAIATVEAGRSFQVRLTEGSRADLKLQTGDAVWLVIKTYSCHLVTR